MEGEPTLDSLLLLHRQVKCNAQSIPTTLGGYQLYYLALVISKEKYNAIQNLTPFRRAQDPGRFEIHLPTTAEANTNKLQTPVVATQRTTRSLSRTTASPAQDPAPTTTNQPQIFFLQR